MSAVPILAETVLEHPDRSHNCVTDNGICPKWIAHNFDRYVDPLLQHLYLTVVSVAIGFAIAFALALLAHRRRGLVAPITQVTGILYTIPSVAAFFLLLPITGRGDTTAIIALVAYTLLIIFRNVIDGLDGVPPDARDAGRGMGLTERQLLWRVELPLALPEIMAGVRVATTTTVGTRGARVPGRRRRARRARSSTTSTSAPTCSSRAAWRCCSPARWTCCCSASSGSPRRGPGGPRRDVRGPGRLRRRHRVHLRVQALASRRQRDRRHAQPRADRRAPGADAPWR